MHHVLCFLFFGSFFVFVVVVGSVLFLLKTINIYYLTISVVQEFESGLTGQFWLRVCLRLGYGHLKASLGLQAPLQDGSLRGWQADYSLLVRDL